jgi:hypothetical protein
MCHPRGRFANRPYSMLARLLDHPLTPLLDQQGNKQVQAVRPPLACGREVVRTM